MNESPIAGDIYLDSKRSLHYYTVVLSNTTGVEVGVDHPGQSLWGMHHAFVCPPKEGFDWDNHQYLGKRIYKVPRETQSSSSTEEIQTTQGEPT